MDNEFEAEIANAIELPRYEYQPISTYVEGSYGLFRDRFNRSFGIGRGGDFHQVLDGECYPLEFVPTEWAPIPDDKIMDFAF